MAPESSSLSYAVYKDLFLALVYFVLSTLFTWWFVAVSPLYISQEQMLLSTAIAGGKWAIQILLAALFLKSTRWVFIKNIGRVCFIGSCILLPYVLLSVMNIASDANFFVGSLVASVLVMICFYYKAILQSGVDIRWWFFWLACLATAITLQLTVVFHILLTR